MNISGGASFATPYWQTADLRLGVVTQRETAPAGSRAVVLSCGTVITAQCPADYDPQPGATVRAERRAGAWHIARDLENPGGNNR